MIEVLSLSAVIVSLLLVAYQGRQLARQTRIAGAVASDATFGPLHEVLRLLVERPQLWPCFDKGAEPPTGEDGMRTEIIAEMLCDAVESALEGAEQLSELGDTSDLSGWPAYADYLLARSPVCRRAVQDHSDWYPRLRKLQLARGRG